MEKQLIKVAKELNVGIETIVEHLASKGFQIENKPNAKITDDMYGVLERKFSESKAEKEKADQIVIGTRPITKPITPVSPLPNSGLNMGVTERKTVSLAPPQTDVKVESKPLEPIERPKIVLQPIGIGKIDLSPNRSVAPTPNPVEKPNVAETPKVNQPELKVEPKLEEKPQVEPIKDAAKVTDAPKSNANEQKASENNANQSNRDNRNNNQGNNQGNQGNRDNRNNYQGNQGNRDNRNNNQGNNNQGNNNQSNQSNQGNRDNRNNNQRQVTNNQGNRDNRK
ncbi:MAG: hypothetical protein HC817_13350 [Saprospiraceae bacterium]|nr:hypothetical protein [Saprospiraceae bacterium]